MQRSLFLVFAARTIMSPTAISKTITQPPPRPGAFGVRITDAFFQMFAPQLAQNRARATLVCLQLAQRLSWHIFLT